MNLIEFIPLITEDQDKIVLRRLDARQQEYVIVGEYHSIKEIPIIYAYMSVNYVLGFNAEGYDGIQINIS